jgi:two-component system sensor histidine kinase PhoQ
VNSLSARFGLSAALVLLIFVLLTAAALERAFQDSARSAVRERLLGQLYLLMSVVEVNDRGQLQLPGSLPEPRLELPDSGLYALIRGEDTRAGWRSASALGLDLPLPPPEAGERFDRFQVTDQAYFVARLGVDWEAGGSSFPLEFAVAEDTAAFQARIAGYRQSLWGWLAAMGVLLLAAQLLVLRWGLGPLRTVATEIEAVEAGRQERLQLDYPRELRPLTERLNALLRHERAQQARYKDALGDLAHSLKTPLAVLRAASEEPGESGLRAALDEQIGRMDHIVQYQLQRAAASGRSVLSAPVPIARTVERIARSMRVAYRDKAVELRTEADTELCFRGNEGDLMELLGNLLDNAYKWSRGTVVVGAETSDRILTISVEDDGPGIAPEQAEALLQRGARMDESVPGHGIGLAMVRAIVEAYEGTLAIERSALGGARMTLRIPIG